MTNPTPASIRPFRVAIPQAALDDLHARLANARYPAAAPGDAWSYGTPVAYLRDMVARWLEFDWRAQEARMNAVPQFLTEIDGQTKASRSRRPTSSTPSRPAACRSRFSRSMAAPPAATCSAS